MFKKCAFWFLNPLRITEKTARLFMHKVREAMKFRENHPMNGTVDIDKFVVGRREKGKVGRNYK